MTTDLLLHHGVDVAATVHHDCGVAAKENHRQHHKRPDRWVDESYCDDAASHSFVLCPDEPWNHY